MQLGTRWQLGTEPPARLPEAVLHAVQSVESELRTEAVDSSQWRWTLTWLEGRPIVELDDGTLIRYDATTDTAQVIKWSESHSPDEGAEE
ncbi:MAG: hypothetical protein ABI400_00245 [Lacisediminihabitans sp.]